MIRSAFPIVSTADLPRALAFYVGVLGGNITYRFPSDGEPQYVGMDLGSSHIGIGADPQLRDEASRRRISLWVYVDDCSAAVEQMRAKAVSILEEPSDQPWGERIARVSDPDGNVIIIGSKIG